MGRVTFSHTMPGVVSTRTGAVRWARWNLRRLAYAVLSAARSARDSAFSAVANSDGLTRSEASFTRSNFAVIWRSARSPPLRTSVRIPATATAVRFCADCAGRWSAAVRAETERDFQMRGFILVCHRESGEAGRGD